MEKMKKSLPSLVGGLSPGNGAILPKAIMTTDTFPKAVAASFTTSMGEFSVAGTAKGSGMIAPDMATLLCFILTDAPVGRKELDAIFRRCVRLTLNSITIDGDMSTNDTAIVLSPATEMALSSREDLSAFEESLLFVLSKLADLLVRDAEGATKLITVNVKGAKSPEDARRAARSVAESLLVKTAMFGRDPNWGRIACAAGYSGAEVEEKSLSILFEDVLLLDMGTPASCDRRRLGEILSRREFTVTVDLGLGNHAFSFLTSDISYDYVKINAEYTT
jgi:glutamate N-acetyltransferase/amino-acid N-acetyltransferase